MHTERQRTATDAIDPQRKIKQRANGRQQPDETYPERRSAGIPFVQQGMGGSQKRGHKSNPAARCGQNWEILLSQSIAGRLYGR